MELQNDKSDYLTRTRTYGEGEIRIGRTIYLHEDIYSIGFISLLKDEIIKQFIDITSGKSVVDNPSLHHSFEEDE